MPANAAIAARYIDLLKEYDNERRVLTLELEKSAPMVDFSIISPMLERLEELDDCFITALSFLDLMEKDVDAAGLATLTAFSHDKREMCRRFYTANAKLTDLFHERAERSARLLKKMPKKLAASSGFPLRDEASLLDLRV